MNLVAVSSDDILPLRQFQLGCTVLNAIKIAFFLTHILAFTFVFNLAHAAENRFGTSLSSQVNHDDNYLMDSENQQTLSGYSVKPKMNYSHDDGFESYSATLEDSIEKYNLSEYNAENPLLSIYYRRVMERSTVNFGYDSLSQSTRVSEFKDSGNIGTSTQKINTATAGWKYKLNHRNSVAVNGSTQRIGYDKDLYADLKIDGIEASLENSLTEKLSVYTLLSKSRYQSELCPPNFLLVSESICVGSEPQLGNAINETSSVGIQAGFKWNVWEQLDVSLGAGSNRVDTTQAIRTPQILTQYGPPIDQDVYFGGLQTNRNESTLITTNMSIRYSLETSTFDLTLTQKVRPSSTGSLLKTQSVDLSMQTFMSEIDWIECHFLAENLRTIDEKLARSSFIDKRIFQGTVKYAYRLSRSLIASASVGYRYQESNENKTRVANAVVGFFAISYTPNEWIW
jgi:hypothetical protein